jgi:hypothetical protein
MKIKSVRKWKMINTQPITNGDKLLQRKENYLTPQIDKKKKNIESFSFFPFFLFIFPFYLHFFFRRASRKRIASPPTSIPRIVCSSSFDAVSSACPALDLGPRARAKGEVARRD